MYVRERERERETWNPALEEPWALPGSPWSQVQWKPCLHHHTPSEAANPPGQPPSGCQQRGLTTLCCFLGPQGSSSTPQPGLEPHAPTQCLSMEGFGKSTGPSGDDTMTVAEQAVDAGQPAMWETPAYCPMSRTTSEPYFHRCRSTKSGWHCLNIPLIKICSQF